MTAIGNWRFLRAAHGPLSLAVPTAGVPSDSGDAAAGTADAPSVAHDPVANAVAALRRSPPIPFSDSPDYDFVGLADCYIGATRTITLELAVGNDAGITPGTIEMAERAWAHHAVWVCDWGRRAMLEDAWVLDGASVRYRFVHDQLGCDLAALPNAHNHVSLATLALAVTTRTLALTSAALDLCRDREVRAHALWLQAMLVVVAAGLRDPHAGSAKV